LVSLGEESVVFKIIETDWTRGVNFGRNGCRSELSKRHYAEESKNDKNKGFVHLVNLSLTNDYKLGKLGEFIAREIGGKIMV